MMTPQTYEQRMPPNYADADSFDVHAAVARIIAAVFKHWPIIVLTIILCLGLVYTYIKMFPPVFTAEVMMQAEPEDDPTRESFYALWNIFRKTELMSEVELMTSGPVVKQVVEELNLTYDDVYHTPLSHVVYLWEQSTIGNIYRDIKAWFFPKEENPFGPTEEEIAFNRTVSAFMKGANLEPVADSHIANLVVVGPTPRVAEYANALALAYTEYRTESFSNEAEAAYEALAAEVAKAMEERDEVMRIRAEFEAENGLALGQAKDLAVMENWAELQNRIQSLKFRLSNLEAAHGIVSEQLANESPMANGSNVASRNPIHDNIRNSVFELQKQLNAALLVYQPGSPEIQDINDQIAELEAQLPNEPLMVDSASDRGQNRQYEELRARKQEIEVEMVSARAELDIMLETQAANERQMKLIPALEHEHVRLRNDEELVFAKLGLLRDRMMQAEVSSITAKSAPPTLKVLDQATAPDKPAWPNTKLLYLVALVLGGAGGVGLAILIEILNNKATRVSLVSRNDLPVYAAIEVTHRSARLMRVVRNSDSRVPRAPTALERLKDPVASLEHLGEPAS